MKIPLTFAELHTPLFLNGVNWNLKLFEKSAKGHLELVYDRAEKELLVTHDKHVAIIPSSNVVTMHPKAEAVKPVEAPAIATHKGGTNPKVKAQAASPMDHVFNGPGHGQTGAATK